MPKRPVRYEKQKKARERALKERKALSYEDVPLEQYDQEEIKLKRPPKKVIRLLPVSYTHLPPAGNVYPGGAGDHRVQKRQNFGN